MFDNQVATVCMPGKFAALCRKLTKDQRDIVEKIGLGKLLNIPFDAYSTYASGESC